MHADVGAVKLVKASSNSLLTVQGGSSYMSLVLRKPDFCICENKAADQLCGNRTTGQRLCSHYTDSTIPLLPKSEILSI